MGDNNVRFDVMLGVRVDAFRVAEGSLARQGVEVESIA
jgi:hypothetical protein